MKTRNSFSGNKSCRNVCHLLRSDWSLSAKPHFLWPLISAPTWTFRFVVQPLVSLHTIKITTLNNKDQRIRELCSYKTMPLAIEPDGMKKKENMCPAVFQRKSTTEWKKMVFLPVGLMWTSISEEFLEIKIPNDRGEICVSWCSIIH